MFIRGSNILLCCLAVALFKTVQGHNFTFLYDLLEPTYMVQLQSPDNSVLCSGVLISLQHVLTAAHCVEDKDRVPNLTVVAGENRHGEGGVKRKISQTFIHPKRNGTYSPVHADVAVLKLNRPFQAGETIGIQTEFCSAPLDVGQNISLHGWYEKDVQILQSETQYARRRAFFQAKLKTIDDQECRKKMSPLLPNNARVLDSTTNFCGYSDYFDPCAVTSGGAVLYENKLCGIVSWNIGCGFGFEYPGIYTSIYDIMPFIKEKLSV